MTNWRSALLDQIEVGLRDRFGRAIVMHRETEDDGALRMSVLWPAGGGSCVRLPTDVPHTAITADEAVEVITDSLWRNAPIVGSA